ncbi:MAG: hypothetical protein KatS3mg089_0894 [Patescibacteria group bacterium]|nr:MAG: hypothetical protein KatS3mg089_0894 [Patescibacteria group bacterium]
MRIMILGSVALPVPPPGQGGTEWIAYHQATGLAERGHSVFLVAARGSAAAFEDLKVHVIEVGRGDVVAGSYLAGEEDLSQIESSRTLRKEIVYLSQAAHKLIAYKDEYDLILNNMRGEGVFLPVAQLLGKPLVNVMHLTLFQELAQLFREYNTSIITISNAQRKEYPDLNYLATVYNGVDVERYTFNSTPKDYLLMMGTIGRHKNQGAAIRIAKKLGMPLVIAGKIRDQDYFEELKSDIDGKQIQYFGEIPFEQKLKLYQQAKAFIFPIVWEEPFGLVMIEAMSCGTPVIAFNRGAVPEVVKDGWSGFVVNTEEEMVEAVKKVESIERRNCRRFVEEHFTIQKMVDGYEQALLSLVE